MTRFRIFIALVVLVAGSAESTPPSADATLETVAVSSWQVSNTSEITLLGTVRKLATQTIATGPGTPPKNWKTTVALVLPRIPLAFGQYIDFVQNGTAQGVVESGTGKVTLDLPLLLRDSTGTTQSFTASLTTAQTNGVNSDGNPICTGGPNDPSVCRGTPRAPSGAFRMVGIVNIPQGGNTRGSGAVLFLELAGSLSLSCAGTVCAASDACHVAGTCDPATGICSNPAAPNGTTCDDATPCTRTDTCQGGTCTGSNPVVCTASDACHNAGTCNPATGACSNPNKSNGTTCNDGNPCTRTDTCQSGVCTGSSPVACTASDACHGVGTCDPTTGACSNPPKPDGTSCNDANACTRTDACQSGVCTGSNPVVCSASDACHGVGTCNVSTGVCSNPSRPNGTSCSDGNACTRTDACQSGACTGSNPVVCTASDACHGVGTCNPTTGACSNPSKPDGTACNDSNACTQGDTCQAGTCTGSSPVVCTASDACHGVGTCSSSTGICSNPNRPNGTTCNDGNPCTQVDACQSGTCIGSSPVVCTASDACHTAGTCNPATGACSKPSKANGTTCTDGSACTRTDTCQAGVCTGSNPVVCAASAPCRTAVCNAATGACSSPVQPDGTGCDDGSSCTTGDRCANGSCSGVPVPLADVGDGLRLGRSGDTTLIAWTPVPGAPISDVARGRLSGLPVGAAQGETCLGRVLAEAATIDGTAPPLRDGFWYLVRANTSCGVGPYGFQNIRGAPPTPRETAICSSSCHIDADCPGAGSECRTPVCTAGNCGFSFASAGVPTDDQTPGDCHRSVCDGSGGVTSVVDDGDVPEDGNPCTQDVCAAGTPSNLPRAAGTACSGAAGGVCNGSGACEYCGGLVQRCCAGYPYCNPGLSCRSGFCR